MSLCNSCDALFSVEPYRCCLPQHLTLTNDPPLPSEYQSLSECSVLEKIQAGIFQTEDQLQRIATIYHNLTRRKFAMEQTYFACKGVLSPIRRVPRELIAEIIRFAIVDEPVGLGTAQGPWKYSQVCRLWREEVLSLPSLWTRIEIQDYNMGDMRANSATNLLFRALSLSQKHLLTLNVRLTHKTPTTEAVMDYLVAHSPRWKNVTFELGTQLLGSLKPAMNRLSCLESLAMAPTSLRGGCSIRSDKLVNIFSDAPALRTVHFRNFLGVDSLNLPWDQITHFSDDTSSRASHSAIQLLRRMPNLVSFETFVVGWEEGEILPPIMPIVHQNLRCLSIRERQDTDILRHLRLPNLSTLHIRSVSDLTHAQTLIQESGCKITTLVIWGNMFCSTIGESHLQTLKEFCTLVQDVTTLDIRLGLPKRMSRFLNEHKGKGWCFPKMRHLKVPLHALNDWVHGPFYRDGSSPGYDEEILAFMSYRRTKRTLDEVSFMKRYCKAFEKKDLEGYVAKCSAVGISEEDGLQLNFCTEL